MMLEKNKDNQNNIEKDRTQREFKEATTYENVCMAEDGTITVRIKQYFPLGKRGWGGQTIRVGEDGYEEVLQNYKNLRPGESLNIVKKLKDGKWVEQLTA